MVDAILWTEGVIAQAASHNLGFLVLLERKVAAQKLEDLYGLRETATYVSEITLAAELL